MPVPMSEDARHPQDHVDEHRQRRRDDQHQPEQAFWLSGFHGPAIPVLSTAGPARGGRLR